MKKIFIFVFLFLLLSSLALAYYSSSGIIEDRYLPGPYGTTATSGAITSQNNAGDYPGTNFSAGAFTGYYQAYDLRETNFSVFLISPAHGTSQTATNVNFTYQLNSTNPANCSLTLNSVVVANSTNLTSGIHNFTQTLAVGTYQWNVTCNDTVRSASSNTWTLTITAPTPAPTPTAGGGGGNRYYEVEVPPEQPEFERPAFITPESLLEKVLREETAQEDSAGLEDETHEPKLPKPIATITVPEKIWKKLRLPISIALFAIALALLFTLIFRKIKRGRDIEKMEYIKRLEKDLAKIDKKYKI